MRKRLQLGNDTIVNYPDRMKALAEDEFHDSSSLATCATYPWERIKAAKPFVLLVVLEILLGLQRASVST